MRLDTRSESFRLKARALGASLETGPGAPQSNPAHSVFYRRIFLGSTKQETRERKGGHGADIRAKWQLLRINSHCWLIKK